MRRQRLAKTRQDVDLIALQGIYVKVESFVSVVKESNQHAGLKLLITRTPIDGSCVMIMEQMSLIISIRFI